MDLVTEMEAVAVVVSEAETTTDSAEEVVVTGSAMAEDSPSASLIGTRRQVTEKNRNTIIESLKFSTANFKKNFDT